MAESLLSILPADYRECIRGDLAEQYNSRAVPSFGFERARRWYWGQVLRALNPIHVLGLARFDKVYKWVTKGRGDSWMQVFLQDLQYGVRTLRKSPVFAGVAVITLALGIGANTAIFSVVDSVLLNPLPYEHGDRLVVIRQQRPLADVTNLGFSVKEIEDYRSQNQTLDALVEYHTMSFILLGLPEPLRVQTGVVSWNFFEVFGLDPLHGRAFLLEEEKVGSEAVFMMSHDFWQKHFGGDPEIVGQTFEMNDKIHTLVGILPPLPQFPNENDVYMPVSDCPFRSRPDFIANRNGRMMSVFGRLKEGTAVENTQADLATIASRMSADHPESYPEHLGFGVESSALRQELTRRARPTLLILLGTVGFVLLIVCANVANLALARMVHREREMAVRSALGAGRGRLLRQMLTESTLLSVLGGGLGILLAAGGLGLLVEFTARFTPRAQEIGIDGSVLLFTLGVSLAAGVGFGLLPALPLSRNKVRGLRDGGRGTAGAGNLRLRNSLIVAQVAVSFVLLIGAGLMVRSLIKLQQVDPGFNPQSVLSAQVGLNWSKYTDQTSARNFWKRLLADLEESPTIRSVAAGQRIPLNQSQAFTQGFQIEGLSIEEGQMGPQATIHTASTGYFETLKIPLFKGRAFTRKDHEEAPGVAIINEAMARHYWPEEDPIGKRLSGNRGRDWSTIVGVVGNVRTYGLDSEVEHEIYQPMLQFPFGVSRLLTRTVGEPMAMARQIREAVYRIDPEQAVAQIQTLEEVRGNSLASPRRTALLLGLFAVLALVITITGISGVIAFSVSQRTQEIGIRMALGAKRAGVVRLILGQGLVLVLVGLVLGIAGAYGLSSIMSGLLFNIEPNDPVTFVAVSALLLMVASLACLIPARRATNVDPIAALRSD